MNSRAKIRRTWVMVFVVSFVSLPTSAKNLRWPELRSKKLITFDWNCSQIPYFPKQTLERLVQRAIPPDDRGRGGTWGDRAFPVKCIRGRTLYFVPLVCSATGNCSWRLYTTNPVKNIGEVNGQYIFTYQSQEGWPTIITYTQMSASEGILSTYVIRKGRYRWLGDQYPIDYQRLNGNRMPEFLVRARRICRGYGG